MYFKQNVYFALENHENPIGMDVYTLDFLVAQLVKNPPAMQETPG